MSRSRTIWKRVVLLLLCLYCLVFAISNRGALRYHLDRTLQEWTEPPGKELPNGFLDLPGGGGGSGGGPAGGNGSGPATVSSHVKFESYLELKLWIDVPNDFPWRKCVLDYNGNAASTDCILNPPHRESSWMVSIWTPQFKVYNYNKNKCLEPHSIIYEDKDNYIFVKECTDGNWSYTEQGQLRWSRGGCLSSMGASKGNHLGLVPCNDSLEDQRFEFGLVTMQGQEAVLGPLDITNWQKRQKFMRDKDLEFAASLVNEALSVAEEDGVPTLERRAVVFYLDKGDGFLAFLRWWLLAWRLLGLNSENEAFDIVLFVHPDSVKHIPSPCTALKESSVIPHPQLRGPGACFYTPLVGISYRDHLFDHYINSHECLVNPAAYFLTQYSHILRSDMDTFPTPAMVGAWPDIILANKYMGYTFKNASGQSNIRSALVEAASYLGIKHHGWHDIGSSWFGPSKRILQLSRITVALSRFLKTYMFGPGTHCRCATCTKLPNDCTWSGGPYAGTLLLYAQEIAMNVVWTESEFNNMTTGHLDYGTTMTDQTVCEMLQLHIFHNAEPFSKFSFMAGQYKDYEMSALNLTIVRDYSLYLALKSAGQGKGEQEVSAKFNISGDGSLAKLCKHLT